jgi:glycosyltransferase involved in cell wall biosynthesis
MKVSVVLCTYSQTRYSDTLETLDSLRKQTYKNLEIVLIIDRNLELYHKYKVEEELYKYPNLKMGLSQLPGLSNARNKGVELSTGDIIAFIDDDAIAENDWIAQLVENYSNPDIIGAGGPMKPYWAGETAQWIPEEFYWTMGCSYKSQKLSKHFVRSNFGSNMSFRREVFDLAGLFDDNFGLMGDVMRTGEETEFSIRALNTITNSKIVFDPDAVVYHRIYPFRKSPLFITKRCLCYGSAVAQMDVSKKQIESTLKSTESSFIEYLLKSSYIDRIYEIIRLHDIQKNLSNLIALSFFTFAVGIGFAVGKVGRIGHSKDRSGHAAFSSSHSPSDDQNVTGVAVPLTFVDIPGTSHSKTHFPGGYIAFSHPSSLDVDQNIAEMAVPLDAMDIPDQREQSDNRLN